MNNAVLKKILAYAYLSAIIIVMITLGPWPIFYLAFAFLALLFILPDNYRLGFSLALILTMVFERYFTLQGLVVDRDVYKLYLIDIVLLLTATSLFLNYYFKKIQLKITWGKPESFFIIWLLIVSAYMLRAIFDINADFAVAFSSFKNYLFYPLIYFLVLLIVKNRQTLKYFYHLIIITGAGLIAFLLIGLARGGGLWTEFTPLSTAGVRYLAGTHAFYMLLASLMAISLLLYKRLQPTTFALMIIAFWFFGLTVSLMRHLWLALAIGLLTIFVLVENNLKQYSLKLALKTSLLLISSLFSILLLVNLFYFNGSFGGISEFVQNTSERALSLFDLSEDSSASWRQELWYDAKNLWEKNPLWGIGFGRTILIDNADWQNFEEVRNIHNSPLAITVQMGLLGISVFGILILSIILASAKNIFKDEDLRPYYIGLVASLIAFIASSLWQPYLETNLMGLWFWLLLGLMRSAGLIAEKTNQ